MVVRSVNNIFPDFSGNIELQQGINLYDANGLVTQPIKIWAGTALTVSDGLWSINYSNAGFSQVLSIQLTIESNITAASEKPVGGYVAFKDNTSANGKVYSSTGVGLLTAVQLVAGKAGISAHVLVIGY